MDQNSQNIALSITQGPLGLLLSFNAIISIPWTISKGVDNFEIKHKTC